MEEYKLYNDKGYVNFDFLWNRNPAYMMIVGGWGTGKTYGCLKKVLETGDKFIYLRRTEAALNISSDEDGNPFKKLNHDLGYNIQPVRKKDIVKYYHCDIDDKGKNIPTGKPAGLGLALSTFSKMRGVDYSDVRYIIYDEFIAMEGETTIDREYTAFKRFYETVNRNREFEGEPPVYCYMLGNPNTLGNAYFIGWNLVSVWSKMVKNGLTEYKTREGDAILVRLKDSPIAKRKQSESVMYRGADEYTLRNGIINDFEETTSVIKSVSLRECAPIAGIGDIGIYKFRSTRGFYISAVVVKDPYYKNIKSDIKAFQYAYGLLKLSYYKKQITFESVDCEIKFKIYMGMH